MVANSGNCTTSNSNKNSNNIINSAKKVEPTSCSSSAHTGIPSTSRSLILLSKSSAEERADNRKNENAEKRKKEEKLKMKAEKDARKV